MKEITTSEVLRKIDGLMDRFFGAGVASHPTIIEQINYLLFMRALSYKDDEYRQLGINDADHIVFDGDLEKYRWENLLSLNAEALFVALEECFRKIPESTTNKTVKLIFRNAHIKLYDQPTLRVVVHEIDEFAKLAEKAGKTNHRDIFGDAYEYLLSKLSQAGTSGQFRTPRHIIDFMVNVIAPQKGETILDPAVGTAGFLVKAFEYLRKNNTSEVVLETGGSFDQLNSKEHTFLYEHTFSGFDSDEDMIKFGMMNLYLHGLQNARLVRQNTLTDTAGNRDKYDVILANPPFSGTIDRDSVAQELQMNTGATEVLFLRYMLDHLTDNGRLGVIVPEGVIFNNSFAYRKIREMLIEKGLWCVVSLPSGVFNPYAGVKTSILFIDKEAVKKVNHILFVKLTSDGFNLSAQRSPSQFNDIPLALDAIERYKKHIISGNSFSANGWPEGEHAIDGHPNINFVSRKEILESESHNLSWERYTFGGAEKDVKSSMVKLRDVCTFEYGKSLPERDRVEGPYPVMGSNGRSGFHISFLVKGPVIIIGRKGSAGEVVWEDESCFPIDTTYYVKLLDEKKVYLKYLYFILASLNLKLLRAGAGIPGLNRNDAYNLEIPLPPLEIQKKISGEIEGYQKIISGAEQIVKNWKPKFDIDPEWSMAKLGQLCDIFGGGTPSREMENYWGGNIPWLSARYFTDEHKIKGSEMITEEGLKNSSSKIAPKGSTILITRVSVGKFAIADQDYAINQDLTALVSKDPNLDAKYLWLVSEIVAERIKNNAVGMSVAGVTRDFVTNQEIPLPSLEVQKQIVENVEIERALIESTKKIIKIYEERVREKIAEVWKS